MKNLIDTWLASELSAGMTQADAIRAMNKTLKCKYTSSRINEWRRGVRVPDSGAHKYMLLHSLPYAIHLADPEISVHLKDPAQFAWRLAVYLGMP